MHLPMLAASAAARPAITNEAWIGYPLGTAFADGTEFGPWVSRFNGYGHVALVDDPQLGRALELAPRAAREAGETHAGLVTTLASSRDFDASVDMLTARQLRADAPNGWEAAWLLWHYTDNAHFYYFLLNATGWELGKEDATVPAQRRFILTGNSPSLVLGRANRVRLVQRANAISVSVDGVPVVSYADFDAPYGFGKFGLYCEDAVVRFGNIAITR